MTRFATHLADGSTSLRASSIRLLWTWLVTPMPTASVVVVAALATLLASIVASTIAIVGRKVDAVFFSFEPRVAHLNAQLMAQQMSKEIIKRYGVRSCGHRCNQGIIV